MIMIASRLHRDCPPRYHRGPVEGRPARFARARQARRPAAAARSERTQRLGAP